MPTNISKSRLRKAFNEGRRAATDQNAQNPYDNVKLRKLWDQARTQQLAGELKTPLPALEHGETRALRPVPTPPGGKVRKLPPPPRGGPSFRDRRGPYRGR